MAPHSFPHPLTPEAEGPPGKRSLGKPSPASKGKTVAKRKPWKKQPIPRLDRHGEFRPAIGWRTDSATPGRSPRISQARHPPNKPRKRRSVH